MMKHKPNLAFVLVMEQDVLVLDKANHEYRLSCRECDAVVEVLPESAIATVNDFFHSERVSELKERFMCLCQLKSIYTNGKTLKWR